MNPISARMSQRGVKMCWNEVGLLIWSHSVPLCRNKCPKIEAVIRGDLAYSSLLLPSGMIFYLAMAGFFSSSNKGNISGLFIFTEVTSSTSLLKSHLFREIRPLSSTTPPGPTAQPQFHSSDILWAQKSRLYDPFLHSAVTAHRGTSPVASEEKEQNPVLLYLPFITTQFTSHSLGIIQLNTRMLSEQRGRLNGHPEVSGK